MSNNAPIESCHDTDIAERVGYITSRVLRLDPTAAVISEDSNLYELGLESLNVVELLSQLEAAFGITIDVEDLSADLFSRFGSLVEFIQNKVAQ